MIEGKIVMEMLENRRNKKFQDLGKKLHDASKKLDDVIKLLVS